MDDPADQRQHHKGNEAQRAAVEAATGERLLKGVVHDAHGEIQLDPELAEGDSASSDPDPDVVEQQRSDADEIESHGEQAADETRGATTRGRPH